MKKIVKRAGLISGIILSAFVIGGCGKTVDLNDCVEVKVSGIDGKGKAEVTVDYDKMETLLAKELNIEVKDKDIENIEDLGSAVDGLSKIDQAENCVNFQVQPADNLKNGDKITVKSIIDEEKAAAFVQGHEVIPVCPEVLGGLSVPRTPAEIVNGEVVTKDGVSVDAAFRAGAARALAIAKENGVELAILQPRSPSCGAAEVYDGTFTGRKIPGQGVFAALLRENGIPVRDADTLGNTAQF